MARLIWDQAEARIYETGVDHGVLYVRDSTGTYPEGVAWNGLTAVTESPTGAEPTDLYADNIKYLSIISAEEFGCTIEAYTYPDEFAICNGEAEVAAGVIIGQQSRRPFGFCYRTIKGNAALLDRYGYILHVIYGCLASPSERAYTTENDSPEAITFSWDCTTSPEAVSVAGLKPTALITIDSTKIEPANLAAIEDILYGSASGAGTPRLPLPDELITLAAGTGALSFNRSGYNIGNQ